MLFGIADTSTVTERTKKKGLIWERYDSNTMNEFDKTSGLSLTDDKSYID